MAECARCGQRIESSGRYGYQVRPIGSSDQLIGVLELMGGSADAGKLLADGWDTCIRCMAILTLDSLGVTEREEILQRFGHGSGTEPA
jgi:hypothetical protein